MSAESRSPFPQTVCSLWIVGFLTYFFSQDLAEDLDLSRLELWFQYVFVNLPSLLNPFDVSHVQIGTAESGWHLFPQRWPFFGPAAVLYLAAIAIGVVASRPLIRAVPLAGCERFIIQTGLGLSLQSLWTLIIGHAGKLTVLAVLTPGLLASGILVCSFLSARFLRKSAPSTPPAPPPIDSAPTGLWIAAALVALPFIILILLSGCSPSNDFDVREYHLQGPKEWFQAGQITFLEHNVYTSFPFLSEMLSLNGMVLSGDWQVGALAGKVILSGFQLLTTLCVFATARRWFGTSEALIAALAYLTAPWTLRISIIAYAEGAITFYLMATAMCALITFDTKDDATHNRLAFVTAMLAGSAMAAKYPGVLSVVIPTGLALLWTLRKRQSRIFPAVVIFTVGVLVTVGPWLIRNSQDTGNPVYPLLYGVFGATDWSPAMDTKWKNAHSAPEHHLASIPTHLMSVMVNNKWTSGLLFALAFPTLLLLRRHRASRYLWFMFIWMLVTWWMFTHRIDRFWIPIMPVVAVLAGAAWTLFPAPSWRGLLVGAVALCSLFNLQVWRLPAITGFQAGLVDIEAAQTLIHGMRPDFETINSSLSQDDRILLVGEAEVFNLSVPVYYNTVFDESLFEQWTADENDDRHWSEERKMKDPDQVRGELQQRGITHVYVNWLEILRYRGPGSYGYTEYVTPERLARLVDANVLSPPKDLSRMMWDDLTEDKRAIVSDWRGSDDLLTVSSYDGKTRWSPIRLYEVIDTKASAP